MIKQNILPNVNIEIDRESGVWTTDGLPMIYAPRHWVIGIHKDVEDALGREKYQELLYQSSYRAAQHWCEQQFEYHGYSGVELMEYYLKVSSQRGLAQFSLTAYNMSAGLAKIELRHCCYVLHHRHITGDKLSTNTKCYAFTGSFSGALTWIARSEKLNHKFFGVETECAAQSGLERCILEFHSLKA